MAAAINTRKSLRNTLLAGYVSMALVLCVAGGWAATADIHGAVIASATIVAESYSKKVQHKEGGIVSRILVKDGDRVTEGQDLIILDQTDVTAELAGLDAVLDELLVKRARLEAQRDGLSEMTLPERIASRQQEAAIAAMISDQSKLLTSSREAARGKIEQLKEQTRQLKEQIKGFASQLASKSKQQKLVEKELASLRKLKEQGLVPNSRILGVEREAAAIEGEIGELVSAKAAAQSRIGEVELQILQVNETLRSEALTELRDTDGKVAELKERRVAISSRVARRTITAPITGSIYQLAVHTEGGVIGAGETLMLIVPEGDDLVLQAQVSPNDIDQVQPGQTAQVRFTAFNANTTPEVTATVQQVAADTSRVDANSPPYYAARLVIAAKELEKLGENKLKPGMAAEVFIQTGARSPLSYLLKPLTDQFSRALREG